MADLHLWSIGPGVYAAEVSVVAHAPEAADEYKRRLPRGLGVEHLTVEVHGAPAGPERPLTGRNG